MSFDHKKVLTSKKRKDLFPVQGSLMYILPHLVHLSSPEGLNQTVLRMVTPK